MNRARALWQDYRNQRRDRSLAAQRDRDIGPVPHQARLLSDASSYAQQAVQMYAQLGAAAPEELAAIHDEIKAEAQQQRSALLELRNVLDAGTAEEQAGAAWRPER